MRSLVSRKATNKNVKNNTIMAKFLYPPIYNGDLLVNSDLIVRGRTSLRHLYVTGNLDISGNIDVSGNLTMVGNADLTGDLMMAGNADLSGNLTMVGDADLSGNLTIVGSIDLSGNVTAVGNVDISGNIVSRGTISASKFLPGQIVNMEMKSYTEIAQETVLTIPPSEAVSLFTNPYQYTPKFATSYVIIEYQTEYSLIGGGNDGINAYINVIDGVVNTTVGESWQRWINTSGGGTRSSVMFPIVGRYTNSSLTTKQITVSVNNATDADNITVQGNKSTWLKITEIGR